MSRAPKNKAVVTLGIVATDVRARLKAAHRGNDVAVKALLANREHKGRLELRCIAWDPFIVVAIVESDETLTYSERKTHGIGLRPAVAYLIWSQFDATMLETHVPHALVQLLRDLTDLVRPSVDAVVAYHTSKRTLTPGPS